MKTFFTIIFFMNILFDLFMITPFGVCWIMKDLDERKPCYGIIIIFITAIPMTIIGSFLGYIH